MVAVRFGHHGQLGCYHAEPGADAGADALAVAVAVADTNTRPDRRRDADTDCYAAADSVAVAVLRLVPTLEGFTVSAARAKWTAAGFTGPFTPASGQTNKTVIKQTTNPASIPATASHRTHRSR